MHASALDIFLSERSAMHHDVPVSKKIFEHLDLQTRLVVSLLHP
jgi:hypothetical protein